MCSPSSAYNVIGTRGANCAFTFRLHFGWKAAVIAVSPSAYMTAMKIGRYNGGTTRRNEKMMAYIVCLALFGHHAESSTRAAFHFPCTRPRCRYRSSLPHLRPYHHVHQISFHFILTTLGQPPYPRSSQSRRPVNRSVEARLAPLPSLLRL